MINISLSRAKFNDDADLSSVISHTGQDFKGLTYLLFLQVVEIHKSEISIILRFLFIYFFNNIWDPQNVQHLLSSSAHAISTLGLFEKEKEKTTALPVR